MEADPSFRDFFFSKMRLIVYGAASMTQDIFERLQLQAVSATGYRIPITTKYGTTETLGIAQVPWPIEKTGCIGVPNPGVVVKLAPMGGNLELRVKSPCVTPGYLNNPDATTKAFDEEGFFRTGDAARLIDPQDPSKGLALDGGVVENFKLTSGSWVQVGQLRAALIPALGIVQDCVVAGHDRDDVRVLVWLRSAETSTIARQKGSTPMSELIQSLDVVEYMKAHLDAYNAQAGGNTHRVRRILLMQEPPTVDEMADKGSINQQAVLRRRKALVEMLYASNDPAIIAEPDA